jgi:sulfur-oxidizing protein SoxB
LLSEQQQMIAAKLSQIPSCLSTFQPLEWIAGKGIDPSKVYKVAGWASVNEPQSTQGERPIWRLVENYLTGHVSRQGQLATPFPQLPLLRGVQLNHGLIT